MPPALLLAVTEMEIVLSRSVAAFFLERPRRRTERPRLSGTTLVPARGTQALLRHRAGNPTPRPE